MRLRAALLALPLVHALGCGGDPAGPDAGPIPATADPDRDILSTALTVDLEIQHAVADVTLAGSDSQGATFEIGDLDVQSILANGVALDFVRHDAGTSHGATLDVGVPASADPIDLTFSYGYQLHPDNFDGVAPAFTFTWPYFCGNMFPCKSTTVDGTQFTLSLGGVPDGKLAVYPTAIASDAPSYMAAWAIDDYVRDDLGTTTAGTHVHAWHTAAQAANSTAGTTHLVAAFDWLETTLGPYQFGSDVGSVAVTWGPGAYGGMEHHPYWHIASDAGSLGSEETHVHEASHGWFGDGIRLACWEDLVLSEGTVTYLAGRALDVVAPSVGTSTWADYAGQLALLDPTEPVWLDTCDQADVVTDNVWNSSIYYRGAYFYRALANKLGAEVVDGVLATFYAAHMGQTASMQDMMDTIVAETGYDPTACATAWLRSTTIPAADSACP